MTALGPTSAEARCQSFQGWRGAGDGRVISIGIRPGRSLRWSPPWPCSDAAVLFDAHSGDYWVLSTAGQVVVHALERNGPQSQPHLLSLVPGDPAEALQLLDDLARSGIVTAQVTVASGAVGTPVRPEPASDTLD